MSKIAILTLPFNNNYGGLLQSYALQFFLKNRSHDVLLINISDETSPNSIIGYLKYILKIIVGKRFRDKKRLNHISKNMVQFVNDNMNCTVRVNNLRDFEKLKSYHFDSYIVGSDQVWRFEYTRDRFAAYFLDFVSENNVSKLAFAASFGVDEWTIDNKVTEKLSKLLKEFKGVSVREKSGIQLCEDYLGVTPLHLLDPIFLLDKRDYEKLIRKNQNQDLTSKKNGLLVYMLDLNADKLKAIELLSNELILSPFFAGLNPEKGRSIKTNSAYPPVSEWLENFMNAKYIITDSFHGCAFAILFNKPFLVYGNNARGMTRFESILETFNLKSRLIKSSSEITDSILNEKINFTYTDEIIRENRLEASYFVEKAGL
jgi:hypothetical protein